MRLVQTRRDSATSLPRTARFLSHHCRWRAARDASFEVHVATRVDKGAAAIEVKHFILHPIPFAARKPIAAGIQRRSPRYIVFIAMFCLR
jgi:hypothetical protein